ncbi:WSC-domain-containing protein [Dentipellis sp. KUC8613]|nr:WSC-domain-containing protein [Dentipellis sp. KUC8613]
MAKGLSMQRQPAARRFSALRSHLRHPAVSDMKTIFTSLLIATTMSIVALGKAVRSDSRLAFCAQGDYDSEQNLALSSPAPGAAKQVQRVGAWKALGCYSDSVIQHALSAQMDADEATVESCTSACFESGFTYAGLEYGGGCFCHNELDRFAAPTKSSKCNIPCAGNSAQICGGIASLTMYRYTGGFEPEDTPVAQVKLHNSGWYSAYVRVIYDGTTSDRLGSSITGGSSHTVNLTDYDLLTEGESVCLRSSVLLHGHLPFLGGIMSYGRRC